MCQVSGADTDPRRADVEGRIERYFDTWSKQDMGGYADLFHPQASIVYLGDSGPVRMALEPFLAEQREAHRRSPAPLSEKAEKVEVWGSSFSGGHVVHVAARDPRVKAFVSQVGSMDGRWVINDPQLRNYTFRQATVRTRGQIGYPRPGEKFGTLTGAPVIEKFVGYAPIEDIGRCEHVAKLFIIAEN
jgi:hypothetical protein